MNRNYKSIILAIALFLALSVSVSAAPGDLDLTFGSQELEIENPWLGAYRPSVPEIDWAEGFRPPERMLKALKLRAENKRGSVLK